MCVYVFVLSAMIEIGIEIIIAIKAICAIRYGFSEVFLQLTLCQMFHEIAFIWKILFVYYFDNLS